MNLIFIGGPLSGQLTFSGFAVDSYRSIDPGRFPAGIPIGLCLTPVAIPSHSYFAQRQKLRLTTAAFTWGLTSILSNILPWGLGPLIQKANLPGTQQSRPAQSRRQLQ